VIDDVPNAAPLAASSNHFFSARLVRAISFSAMDERTRVYWRAPLGEICNVVPQCVWVCGVSFYFTHTWRITFEVVFNMTGPRDACSQLLRYNSCPKKQVIVKKTPFFWGTLKYWCGYGVLLIGWSPIQVYYPGPTLLDFDDQMGTGMCNVSRRHTNGGSDRYSIAWDHWISSLVYYQLCRPHQFCCDRSLGAVMCCCLSSCITPIDFPAGDERHNYMDFLARAQNTGNTTPSCFAVSTDTQYTRQQESVSQLDTQQAREYCRGWMSLYGKYVFVRSAAANTQALSHWIIIVPWNRRLRVRQPKDS
jgi:hypothetical protein